MFQEFFKDTLGGRYIKTILQETPIPVFNSVIDGDTLVSGMYYVYKDFIIQCETGGILKVSKTDQLYPSDTLYPSVYLYPGTGYRPATFYVRSLIDVDNPKIMRAYKSKHNYYDSETHMYLGRYLRYLRARTNLNLMPFYNCYNHKSIPDIQLVLDSQKYTIEIEEVSKQKYKLVSVPILFGKSYTIHIDCTSQVLVRSIIYSKSIDLRYVDELKSSGVVYNSMNFKEPKIYSVETSNPNLAQQERNLYLLIQLPADNDSSIVVMENFEDKQGVFCDEESVRQFDFLNPGLLYMNTRVSYAFSDRLIEYLVGNVIHRYDNITQNISKIQKALSTVPPVVSNKYKDMLDCGHATYGMWDEKIPEIILQMAHEYSQNNFILDQDGNINVDIEKLILSKGAKY